MWRQMEERRVLKRSAQSMKERYRVCLFISNRSLSEIGAWYEIALNNMFNLISTELTFYLK